MPKRLKPGEFAELTAFTAVAKAQSFRIAARELGLSPSTLSHAVKALEGRIGVRLLHRTTRAVAPTEIGMQLLRELAPAFQVVEQAIAAAGQSVESPAGTVRIAAPPLAIRALITPMMGTIARRFPSVVLDVRTVDRPGDPVSGGFDLVIALGDDISNDMIAVALTEPFVTAIVASPAYFASHDVPVEPADLALHRCIGCLSGPGGSLYRWRLQKGDRTQTIDVSGPLVTDDPDLMLGGALAGIGLWHGVEIFARPYLDDGRLIRVLADWSPTALGFMLCYTAGAPQPPAVRAVIDVLKAGPPPPASSWEASSP